MRFDKEISTWNAASEFTVNHYTQSDSTMSSVHESVGEAVQEDQLSRVPVTLDDSTEQDNFHLETEIDLPVSTEDADEAEMPARGKVEPRMREAIVQLEHAMASIKELTQQLLHETTGFLEEAASIHKDWIHIQQKEHEEAARLDWLEQEASSASAALLQTRASFAPHYNDCGSVAGNM